MGGEKPGCFGQRGEVAARSGDRALPGDEFHAPSLTDSFGLAQQDACDLAGLADVCAAAGGEIEVADVDQPQLVSLSRRKFAQAELPCFFASDMADVDGAILEDDLVGEALGLLDLFFGQRGSVEVDLAIVVGHVERHGRHVVQPHERGRQHVLSRMLLHVVTAARGVNQAMDAGPRLEVFGRFHVVDDFAIFGLGDFGDAQLGGVRWTFILCAGRCRVLENDPAGVEDLPAAGGIERGAVENQRRARRLAYLPHFGVEVVEEGVVVVETVGHRAEFI